MKIKCPGCGRILQIPESAAGKVVRCQCGKQMRAPGGAAAPMAAAPTAAAPTGGSTRGRASAPAAGGFGDFDAGLFDELTETDLQSSASRQAPAASAASGGGGTSDALRRYAPPGEIQTSKPAGKRPGLLTFLGVINGIAAVAFAFFTLAALGLAAIIPALGDELDEPIEGTTMLLAAGVMGFTAALSVATAVACFVGRPVFWYVILFSYAYAFGDRIIAVANMVVEGQVPERIVGGGVALAITLAILVYLHGESVRDFYRSGKLSVGKALGPNAAGVLIGLGLAYAVRFLE